MAHYLLVQQQQNPTISAQEKGQKPHFWPILAPSCPNLGPGFFIVGGDGGWSPPILEKIAPSPPILGFVTPHRTPTPLGGDHPPQKCIYQYTDTRRYDTDNSLSDQ